MSKVTLTRRDGKVDRAAHRKVAKLKGLAPHEFFGVVHGATDCHCVVCGKGLSDALSCTKMIGPVCSRKYYSDEPVVSDETMSKVIGMVAALDGRVSENPGSIDEDVIDFLMANKCSSRAFANILLAWGSVNAAKAARHKVLSITPIFRELGYGNLADRLEKDRTPQRIEPGADTFKVILPRPKLPLFGRKAKLVDVPCHKEKTPSGITRALVFKNTDKPVVWALLAHQFGGKPLSIEGKGVVLIPQVTQAQRDLLNARDIRGRQTPNPMGFMCRLEVDPSNSKLLRVFCTPPWEADEARAFVDALRSLKGRRWERDHKCWSVPASKRAKVAEAAKTHFGLTV